VPLELTLRKCGSFFAEESALFLGNLFTQPTLAHTVHRTVQLPFRRLHNHNHHYHHHHDHDHDHDHHHHHHHLNNLNQHWDL